MNRSTPSFQRVLFVALLSALMTACPPPQIEPLCSFFGPVCVNDCPAGQLCNEACTACVLPTDPARSCQMRDPGPNQVCIDNCETGTVCDPKCEACIDDPAPSECNDVNGVCTNNCPEGEMCDPECNSCVPEGDIDLCQLVTPSGPTYCADNCPDGQQCDPECRACAPVNVPKCNLTDGVCINNCPNDLLCDNTCTNCVEGDEVFTCQVGADQQCIDNCPGNLVCNPECNHCVQPRAPTRSMQPQQRRYLH